MTTRKEDQTAFGFVEAFQHIFNDHLYKSVSDDDGKKSNLACWAANYIGSVRDCSPLTCRHENCFTMGTAETDKHPGIRKSSLEKDMISFVKKSITRKYPSKVSTKVRAYHIAFVAKFKDLPLSEFKDSLDRLKNPNDYVIRHTCGCNNCCNPRASSFGKQA